jgi:type I restriction enzyme S subunit
MRDGWMRKAIGEIAVVAYGYTDKAKPSGDFRYIRITDIDSDGLLSSDNKMYVSIAEDISNFLLIQNDLLMARTGATFAKVLLYTDYEPSIFASYLIRISFNRDILNKLYWYFSKSEDYWQQANSLSSGSAQPHFNGAALKRVLFKYPESAVEQKQIVSILDKAFEAIDKAKANIEKNIQNAEELFQSKLNEIFSQKGDGWEEKALDDICDKTNNINWKDNIGKNFKYIDLSSVSRESLEIEDFKEISSDTAPSRAKKIVVQGDVIFATTRPTLKRATKISSEFSGHICSTGFVVLRPRNDVKSDWVFFYLLTSEFMNRMEELQKGASYPAVTDSDVKGSKINIPLSSSEQDNIIENLRLIRSRKNQLVKYYLGKLKLNEELKKSILQKAFNGELTDDFQYEIEEELQMAAEPKPNFYTK